MERALLLNRARGAAAAVVPQADPTQRAAGAPARTPDEARFERVGSADDDRILRRFRAVLRAALRTNYYRRDAQGRPPATFALKLDARQIGELPQPRPLFEIYVYSPEVEGVHLRMGPVARGEAALVRPARRLPYRVLGLMKAQNVKNTLIVPAGAKGGFVPRRLQPRWGARSSSASAWPPTAASSAHCSRSPTTSCGATACRRPRPAPRWRRSLPGGGGGQGTASFSDIGQRHRARAAVLAR
jgi:hypothetical protein